MSPKPCTPQTTGRRVATRKPTRATASSSGPHFPPRGHPLLLPLMGATCPPLCCRSPPPSYAPQTPPNAIASLTSSTSPPVSHYRIILYTPHCVLLALPPPLHFLLHLSLHSFRPVLSYGSHKRIQPRTRLAQECCCSGNVPVPLGAFRSGYEDL